MIWLIGQLWPFLLLSALAGAACVAVWGQRRVTSEVWEDVPVTPAAPADPAPEAAPEEKADEEPAVPASVTAPVPVDADDPDSPFPVPTAAGEPAPWEQEELWSRPARVSASGEARRPKDEWSEAAENWRSWADQATGRGFVGDTALDPSDRDLFAADREAGETAPVFPSAGEPDGTGPPTVESSGDEDVFPYARPVEAPLSAEGTMDPMGDDEMDDDEREAAEIRRMREQARRGEAE